MSRRLTGQNRTDIKIYANIGGKEYGEFIELE